MRKVFLLFLMMGILSSSVQAADKWRNGDGSAILPGTTVISDIDSEISAYLVEPITRPYVDSNISVNLLYSSASQLTLSAGSLGCRDTTNVITRLRRNTTATTVTWSDIDTGAEAGSTTYYVYADCDADATTWVAKISASSSAPSSVTYYKQIGSFINDGSSNITNVNNNHFVNEYGAWTSKSTGVAYQATTDAIVCANILSSSSSTSGYITGYTDSSSSPSTVRGYASVHQNSQADHSATRNSFCMPVRAGDYYQVDHATWAGASNNGTASVATIDSN